MIIEGVRIEHTDGFVSLALCTHRDKSKPFAFAADAVRDDIDRGDVACPRKESL
jgi:hypothetical protein